MTALIDKLVRGITNNIYLLLRLHVSRRSRTSSPKLCMDTILTVCRKVASPNIPPKAFFDFYRPWRTWNCRDGASSLSKRKSPWTVRRHLTMFKRASKICIFPKFGNQPRHMTKLNKIYQVQNKLFKSFYLNIGPLIFRVEAKISSFFDLFRIHRFKKRILFWNVWASNSWSAIVIKNEIYWEHYCWREIC